jgi:hypothetical protein
LVIASTPFRISTDPVQRGASEHPESETQSWSGAYKYRVSSGLFIRGSSFLAITGWQRPVPARASECAKAKGE